MEIMYQPYIDPNFESLFERINPPRVCIDNDTCHDCTLVKVDSANKNGILLEMVQVLTDLDLVISKSYISSDGGWLMDVFHVTDQQGNKLVDESLLLYIQQAICTTREGLSGQALPSARDFTSRHMSPEHTALEIVGTDRTGLLSEVTAVLTGLECHITSSVAWTHNGRTACIIYVEDELHGGTLTDPLRLTDIESKLGSVVGIGAGVGAEKGKRQSVRVSAPSARRTHTERRLHQLMFADRDYEGCCGCRVEGGHWRGQGTHVSIESWKQKGYSVVNIRSRDRPKLLFDTVCALTEMNYVVSHASISSEGPLAYQEYFIRRKNGYTLETDTEKDILTQCLVAAIERRVSHGLRLDISARNRSGLWSDVTRAFRENGLSITRADTRTRGERSSGTFYLADASKKDDIVDWTAVERVKNQIRDSVFAVNISSEINTPRTSASVSRSCSGNSINEERPRLSFGSLLWSKLERISSNFGPIRL